MANFFSVQRSKHSRLLAGVLDVITFTKNVSHVTVLNRGAGPIYLTASWQGAAPTVAGDDTYVALPNLPLEVDLDEGDVVRLIAAADTDYSVVGS